jgi:hypothetical protein
MARDCVDASMEIDRGEDEPQARWNWCLAKRVFAYIPPYGATGGPRSPAVLLARRWGWPPIKSSSWTAAGWSSRAPTWSGGGLYADLYERQFQAL